MFEALLKASGHNFAGIEIWYGDVADLLHPVATSNHLRLVKKGGGGGADNALL